MKTKNRRLGIIFHTFSHVFRYSQGVRVPYIIALISRQVQQQSLTSTISCGTYIPVPTVLYAVVCQCLSEKHKQTTFSRHNQRLGKIRHER